MLRWGEVGVEFVGEKSLAQKGPGSWGTLGIVGILTSLICPLQRCEEI